MINYFSQIPANDYTLHPARIDIWEYPLHTEYPIANTLLNAAERQRAQRYYFDKHRRRFIIARSMMRQILAQYISTPAKLLIFTENKYGKPHLVNNIKLQFNLSHSRDLALLAIGQNYPLGVDLEFFSARPYTGIGTQMFSITENNALQNTPKTLQPLAFFNIWAQKEAFIKACGLGLSYPTKTFDVPILSNTLQPIFDELHQTNWNMRSFSPKIGCSAALCANIAVQNIRYLALHDLNEAYNL